MLSSKLYRHFTTPVLFQRFCSFKNQIWSLNVFKRMIGPISKMVEGLLSLRRRNYIFEELQIVKVKSTLLKSMVILEIWRQFCLRDS